MEPPTPMTARPFVPASGDLAVLAASARKCQGCPLYLTATQTVFGEGRGYADVMMVGEQPGDQEDHTGRPFVGPAGAVLDKALEEAGWERADVYVTNAVKHFKWTPAPTGGRRLHAKPLRREVLACRPWLEAELHSVKPRKVLCLGATAAFAVLGRPFAIGTGRGRPLFGTGVAPLVMVTAHPSSILRARDEDRRIAYQRFVDDLKALRSVQVVDGRAS